MVLGAGLQGRVQRGRTPVCYDQIGPDSAAATVGSVCGALQGALSFLAEVVGPTSDHVCTAVRDFDRNAGDSSPGRRCHSSP